MVSVPSIKQQGHRQGYKGNPSKNTGRGKEVRKAFSQGPREIFCFIIGSNIPYIDRKQPGFTRPCRCFTNNIVFPLMRWKAEEGWRES